MAEHTESVNKATAVLRRRAESIDDATARERYLFQNPDHRGILRGE